MSAPFGTYFIDRDQPPVSPEEVDVVRAFHELYYRRWLMQGADTITLSWFGHKVAKLWSTADEGYLKQLGSAGRFSRRSSTPIRSRHMASICTAVNRRGWPCTAATATG